MAEVTLPDGTIVKNVPEGMSPEDVQRGLEIYRNMHNPFAGASKPNHPTMSDLQSFGRGAANRVANAAANIPDFVANIGARAITPAVRSFQPGQYGSEKPLNTAWAFNAPALGQDFVPGPDGHDLLGGVQRGGELASALVNRDFGHFSQDPAQDQRELTQKAMEENPMAYFLGQVGGDVLTLTTLRAPISNSRGNQELISNQIIGGARSPGPTNFRAAARQAAGVSNQEVSLASGVSDALRSMTNTTNWRWLRNRAGRAGETGMEALTLSALNGEADPIEAFGFAAGMQMAGSGFLGTSGSLLSGNIKDAGVKLGIAALATGSIFQVAKELTAGGRDFILESMESGFGKVALFLATGALAGATGMGRVTPMNAQPERFSARVADAISSLPRAATISLITEGMDDPATNAVIRKLAVNPSYFGTNATRRLERAYLNGNFRNELESLMSVEEFRKKFEAIQ